jgi:hypothetical protein
MNDAEDCIYAIGGLIRGQSGRSNNQALLGRWCSRRNAHGRNHELDGARAVRSALQYSYASARPEVKKTGAYLLIGPDPGDANQTMVYVGEGDNVGVRLSIHNKDTDKEFWEQACVITSKELNLTKAHARYLESKLIKIIRQEGL